MNTYFYGRVSTIEQDAFNQVLEAKAAGFDVRQDSAYCVLESVSGSVHAGQRVGFSTLLERMQRGDVLVVTKLDRLGRDAIDVMQTVDLLAQSGIRVHCLQLGGADLTSSAGKMIMGVLTVMAQFERDLIIERTKAGLEKAKAAGKKLGRPVATITRLDVEAAKTSGLSQSKAATKLNLSLGTVKRYWNP